MKRDQERHYIMIKRSIQEEYITIINIYAPNRSTAICKTNANKYEMGNNNNKIIVGGFNTPLTSMDRSTKQKLTRKHKL